MPPTLMLGAISLSGLTKGNEMFPLIRGPFFPGSTENLHQGLQNFQNFNVDQFVSQIINKDD